MRRKFAAIRFLAICLLASCISASIVGTVAAASDCPGNPNALGTSRTIAVDPNEHQRLGSFQYRETLPLNDHEVVITFDDGPLSPFTSHILDTLAKECVKATFFMVGRMARAYPHLVQRVYAEGHTIGNHSQNHPFSFARMTVDQAAREIEDGFTSIRTALGEPSGVTRFFRIPGLLRQAPVENYLASRGYLTWSVDFMADDWTRINAGEVVRRALERLEARGRGILLLHDIHLKTALALPTLLQELKTRGYRIVHVVQADPDHPKTATLPEQWMARTATRTMLDGHWPLINVGSLTFPEPVLRAPDTRNFGISDASGTYEFGLARADRLRGGDHDIRLPVTSIWRHSVRIVGLPFAEPLPAPDASNFRYAHVWKTRPMVARRGTHKGPTTAATVAPIPIPVAAPASAPRGAPPAAPKNNNLGPQPPRPPRPIGHQLQLPKPTTTLGG
jgi:peptidoglycan/xylan/chitin deacetylase (PgdA/CDA1 family)